MRTKPLSGFPDKLFGTTAPSMSPRFHYTTSNPSGTTTLSQPPRWMDTISRRGPPHYDNPLGGYYKPPRYHHTTASPRCHTSVHRTISPKGRNRFQPCAITLLGHRESKHMLLKATISLSLSIDLTRILSESHR